MLNPASPSLADDHIKDLAKDNAQVVWLLGKVQSGKSSIIKALTGENKIAIGEGFAACTKRSFVYDFPKDTPLIRFMDTRGLEEADYDATEDIDWCEEQAHLLIAVMRAPDQDQETIVQAIRDIRKRHPDWPVIVAQTTLHELYPTGISHTEPYPFHKAELNAEIPDGVSRALALQQSYFKNIAGNAPIIFVPIDFTLEEDGFETQNYGLEALEDAIQKTAPLSLLSLKRQQAAPQQNELSNAAHPHIVGYSAAAAAADLMPALGAIAVPAIQAKLLHSLAQIYDIEWTRQRLAEFAGALGVGAGARYALGFAARQLGKLIPGYGQTAGAALAASMSFAATYALGIAASAYLGRLKLGEQLEEAEIAEIYAKALEEAFEIAKRKY